MSPFDSLTRPPGASAAPGMQIAGKAVARIRKSDGTGHISKKARIADGREAKMAKQVVLDASNDITTRMSSSTTPTADARFIVRKPTSSSMKTPKLKRSGPDSPPGQVVAAPRRNPPNLNTMPAEIQQMIWGNVIMGPSCHTFKLSKAQEEQDERPIHPLPWSVELWAKGTELGDNSAYHLWKNYHSLKNIAFYSTFNRMTDKIKPISLRKPKTVDDPDKPCNEVAAIDEHQDLVILDLNRARHQKYLPFNWLGHTNVDTGLDALHAREVLSPFRRVAIIWKNTFNCNHDRSPFYCYCQMTPGHRHHVYKACPRELGCFLDLFPNLQEFYFVVEPERAKQINFTATYRSKVAEADFVGSRPVSHDPTVPLKSRRVDRFHDAKYEYLVKLPTPFLEAWGMESPWAGPESEGGAEACLTETQKFYKSQLDDETFCQNLELRKRVRFGIVIRTQPKPIQSHKGKSGLNGQTKQQGGKKKNGRRVAKLHRRPRFATRP